MQHLSLSGLWPLLIRGLLASVAVITFLLFASGILFFFDPLFSLPHLLYQARYGLLIWRCCLYAAIVGLWWHLHRRLPSPRQAELKRVLFLASALVAFCEAGNLLQLHGGYL
ncbi:hypothetical protein ACU62C_02510 [Klebsiella aerogenes]